MTPECSAFARHKAFVRRWVQMAGRVYDEKLTIITFTLNVIFALKKGKKKFKLVTGEYVFLQAITTFGALTGISRTKQVDSDLDKKNILTSSCVGCNIVFL